MSPAQAIALTTAWFTWTQKEIAKALHLARTPALVAALRDAYAQNKQAGLGPASWYQLKEQLSLIGNPEHVNEVVMGRRPTSEGVLRGLAALARCELRAFSPDLEMWIARAAWHLIGGLPAFAGSEPFSEAEALAYARFLLAQLASRHLSRDQPEFVRQVELRLHDNEITPLAARTMILKVADAIGLPLDAILNARFNGTKQ